MDRSNFIERRVREIKEENARQRNIRFRWGLLYGLAILICMIIEPVSNVAVASSTTPPTRYDPFSTAEAVTKAESDMEVTGATVGLSLLERRPIEDSYIKIWQESRFSWPYWNITEPLPYTRFIERINNEHKFPFDYILKKIIRSHEGAAEIRDFSALTGEIINEGLKAHGEMVTFIYDGGNIRDFWESREHHALYLGWIVFYFVVLFYGPGAAVGTWRYTVTSSNARNAEEQQRAFTQAEGEFNEIQLRQIGHQLQSVTAQLEAAQENAEQTKLLTIMAMIPNLNKRNARVVLDSFVKIGLINNPSSIDMLSRNIDRLCLEDDPMRSGGGGGRDIGGGGFAMLEGVLPLSRVNAAPYVPQRDALTQLSMYGDEKEGTDGARKGGGKKSKKIQKGGAGENNINIINFNDDAYHAFMQFLIECKSPMAIYFAYLVGEIEAALEELYYDPNCSENIKRYLDENIRIEPKQTDSPDSVAMDLGGGRRTRKNKRARKGRKSRKSRISRKARKSRKSRRYKK